MAVILAGPGASCRGPDPSPASLVAAMAGAQPDERIIDTLIEREQWTREQARARAIQTLQLVEAARRQTDSPNPLADLSPRRAEHLRRAALVRLWLKERFEPNHQAHDIPDDDPLLVQARRDPRLVHPALHRVCQVVVEPAEPESSEPTAQRTAEPQWRTDAALALEPLLRRIERNVPPGDAQTCTLIQQEVELSRPQLPPHLRLTFSAPGGFDLDACAQVDADDRCIRPRFAPEWTAVVRATEIPGLTAPFFTRFGLHLVYVQEYLPAQTADDPQTESIIRHTILPAWRSQQLERRLEDMRQARQVRMAPPSDGRLP